MNTILEGKTIYMYSRAEHPRFRKVINMGIKLFNHLSTELKPIDEFHQFRKEVKLFLLNKPLYTLEEYFDW